MDKVALYRQYIQQLIQAKADRSMKSAKDVEAQPIFDTQRVGLCPAAGIAINWCMWSRRYHPDLNPGDKDAETKFKELNEGQSLRLRGKGWTLPKGGRGDLFAKLQIVTPQNLSAIEQEYYEKIQANTSFNPRTQLEEIKL